MRVLLCVIVLVVLLLVIPQSFFTVDRTEYVYLTQFGRPVATYDGASEADAGLHFKLPWPIQSVQRLDRRLQYFDLPAAELLTHDPRGRTIDKTLTIDAYVCWQIADRNGVDRFIRTVGTADQARTVLGQRISSELGAAIGQMELDDLISAGRLGKDPLLAAQCAALAWSGPLPVIELALLDVARVAWNREQLRQRLLHNRSLGSETTAGDGLSEWALREYGIELVDIRLRRTSHPPQVRQAIFDSIVSERNKKVADYQSRGAQQAEDIRSAADRKVKEVLAEAQAQDRRIRGEADAEADRIRNQAHSKDVEFYTFLKKLEEYQRILGDNKSMLLLSSHRELFDLLFQPPRPQGSPAPKPGGP